MNILNIQKQKLAILTAIAIVAVAAITVAGIFVFNRYIAPSGIRNTSEETNKKNQKAITVHLSISAENLEAAKTTKTLAVSTIVKGDRTTTKVVYYLDGKVAGSSKTAPFAVVLDISKLSVGEHSLQAFVYDTNGSIAKSEPFAFKIADDRAVTPASDQSRATVQQSTTPPTSTPTPAPPAPAAPPAPSDGGGSDTPAPPPPSGSKPSASNTGVPAGTTLTHISGNYTVSTNGAVVDGLDIEGQLSINANNVTVKNTRVRCINEGSWCIEIIRGRTGTIIQDTEIGGGANGTTFTGTSAGILLSDNNTNSTTTTRVSRVNIHHTVDGLRADGNATITASYIHSLQSTGGVHADASQTTGWSNIVFSGNTIVGGLNAAIFFNQEPGNPPITNVTVDGNWLYGTQYNSVDYTSYPLYVNGGTSGVIATNNKFNRGSWAPASPGSYAVWSNNTYEDNGETIPHP